MKKYIAIILLSLSAISYAHAQEYKVNKSNGKIILNLPSVTVEGYNGTEIIFSTAKKEAEADPRAKGLRAIDGSGHSDNTGLGISVEENGSTLEVNQVGYANGTIKILVPKNVIISLVCHKLANAGNITFKNLENEIEVSTDYNKVNLENITGPVSVRALYGSVDATFSEHLKGPVSIASIYSTVDVTIPQDTRANVKLSSSHGEIMASSGLKIVLEKNGSGDMISYGNVVNGKLNGGGADFKLSSEYSKIYLRETK